MEQQTYYYDNKIVKMFVYATITWGIVAMIYGLLIALQLAFPVFNFGFEFTTFGRIRPIHTNAAIFAFVGNAIFAGSYYSMQRLLKTRMYSDWLSKINFWGWQLIIVLAAITFTLGFTTSKEYAELEWPIDILIAIVWVIYGWNMFGTIAIRRVKHIYVAIWFYIASFVAVALLHIVNSLELPVTFMKSYSVFAGVQDGLVQWWYGHNAVAFFLTTPYLGLMYYFVPKAANRPVYSYKLSIIHFWTLIFLYIWAGPHHLLYSALPDWAQSLGVVFSIMLIAPSWGGMLNGLLTLRGVWDKVREDAILKFFAVAVTAYGMSTLEGPLLSLKTVNALSHFTDWTVAHVHIGTLGWNGFLTFGMLYWLVPRIFKTKLFSNKLANIHFWIGTLGILFYAIPLYWAAFTQTLMWKEFTADGYLAYPNFMQTVTQVIPMYITRVLGGTLYLIGAIIMVYNLVKTIKSGSFVPEEKAQAPALEKEMKKRKQGERVHAWIERRHVEFYILIFIAVAIGGAVEIIPMLAVKSNVPSIESVKPYTPLELEGRDVYIKEGCNNCHSQEVRPFRSETERYGEYSKAGESVYDHPFLFGSRRMGPDLARTGVPGGKMFKSAAWNYKHFMDPQDINKESVMPKYPWLGEKDIDTSTTIKKLKAMYKLGVPYPENYDKQAMIDLKTQADGIVKDLKQSGIEVQPMREVVALIAYLHRLGRDLYQGSHVNVAKPKTNIPKQLTSVEDIEAGKKIFAKNCAVCHGAEAQGKIGPSLKNSEWKYGGSFAEVYKTVYEGNIGMPSFKRTLPEKDLNRVVSFILSLGE